MPGFDGTGPMGQGPMTGGGRGYCAMPLNTIGRPPFTGRFAGRGRGRGFRNWYYATGIPGWARAAQGVPAWGQGAGVYPRGSEISPQQEAQFLKEQLKAMETEIKSINERIAELDSIAQK